MSYYPGKEKQVTFSGQTDLAHTQLRAPVHAMDQMHNQPTTPHTFAQNHKPSFRYYDTSDQDSYAVRQNFKNSMKERPGSAKQKPPFQHNYSEQLAQHIYMPKDHEIDQRPNGLPNYHPIQQNMDFSHPLSSSFRLNAHRINENEIQGPKVRDLIEYSAHPVGDMIPTQMMRHVDGQLDPYQKVYERPRALSPKSNHDVPGEKYPLVDPSVYPWPHQTIFKDNPHPFPTHASQYLVNRRNGSVLHPQQLNSNLCVPQRNADQYQLCNVSMIRKPDEEEIFWVFKEQIHFYVQLDQLRVLLLFQVALCKQPDFRVIDIYEKVILGKNGKIIPDSLKNGLQAYGIVADVQDCALILLSYNGHSNMKFKNFSKIFQPDAFCEKILNDAKPIQKEFSPQTTELLRQFFKTLLQCEYISEVMRQTITKKKVNLKQVFKNLSQNNEGLCTFYSLQFMFQSYGAHEITPFGIKLLMKKIDTNLRGAIPMVEFLNYFGPKIKKFAQIE